VSFSGSVSKGSHVLLS